MRPFGYAYLFIYGMVIYNRTWLMYLGSQAFTYKIAAYRLVIADAALSNSYSLMYRIIVVRLGTYSNLHL